MDHEFKSEIEKFMAVSSETRRCIIAALLEAAVKNEPMTIEDLQKRVPRKTINQQIDVLQKIGFVYSKVVDLPDRSPHEVYFLTPKATEALNEMGMTKSLVEHIYLKNEMITY